MFERNCWCERPLATERDTRSALESSPSSFTSKSVRAASAPFVINRSRTSSLARAFSTAEVVRVVESTPDSCTVSMVSWLSSSR